MSTINKVITGEWEDIKVYPDTSMVRGERTGMQRLRKEAEKLYDEWVCDRRYDPADVALMILLQATDDLIDYPVLLKRIWCYFGHGSWVHVSANHAVILVNNDWRQRKCKHCGACLVTYP